MRCRSIWAGLFLFLAPWTLRADPVTPGAIAQLLTGLGVTPAVAPEFAMTRVGPGIVAWQEGSGAQSVVRYAFLDAQGQLAGAPLTFMVLPGDVATRPRVAAGFATMILVCEVLNGATFERDVFFLRFGPAGNLIGSGNPAVFGNPLDEFHPNVAIGFDGSFAIVWVRTSPISSGQTEGVWIRRYDALGLPADSAEVRTAITGFTNEREPAVVVAVGGGGVVVWTDGQVDTPSTASSPDGHGTAILGVYWNSGLAFSTPFIATGVIQARDQWGPRLSASDRQSCALGFTTDVSDTEFEAASIQLTMTGQYWPIPGVLTATIPGSQTLRSVAMTSSEEMVSLYDEAAGPGSGRLGYARSTLPLGVFDSGLIDPSPIVTQNQDGGAVAVDQYGNFRVLYTASALGSAWLSRRDFRRAMILPAGSLLPGTATALLLDSPNDPGAAYFLALSLGQGPIQVDTRVLALSPDFLFFFSITPAPGLFDNFAGPLDVSGRATAILTLPPLPSLTGQSFFAAFVTLAAPGTVASNLNTISDRYPLTIL